jgi:hypothetical protein
MMMVPHCVSSPTSTEGDGCATLSCRVYISWHSWIRWLLVALHAVFVLAASHSNEMAGPRVEGCCVEGWWQLQQLLLRKASRSGSLCDTLTDRVGPQTSWGACGCSLQVHTAVAALVYLSVRGALGSGGLYLLQRCALTCCGSRRRA